MPGHWKVREAVAFNQALKNDHPKNIPREIGDQILAVTLEAFGLSGVANTYIGDATVRGISGGQRRRVSLARGTISSPALLFCDEPTSGLSATDAETCMKSLRIIAKKFGVLIVVVIHQPRAAVAALFDTLLLLTSDPGRVVYYGPMAEAVPYWESCGYPIPPQMNATDILLDMITPDAHLDKHEEFVALFIEKQKPILDGLVDAKFAEKGLTVPEMLTAWHDIQASAQMRPPQTRLKVHVVPFHMQLAILCQRKVRITMRNPAAVAMPIFIPVVLGVLLGAMFQGIGHKGLQQQLSFVYTLLMVLTMTPMQMIPTLMQDRTIMKYDTSERLYSEWAFIASALLIDIPMNLLGAFGSAVTMYAFSEVDWKYFPVLIGWSMLLFFFFDSLFSCIGAWSKDLQQAQVACLPFNSIFSMFSGFLITKANSPKYLRWIFSFSPNGYGMEAIVLDMAPDFGLEGDVVVKTFGFEKGESGKGAWLILVMIVFCRIMQVICLKKRNDIQK